MVEDVNDAKARLTAAVSGEAEEEEDEQVKALLKKLKKCALWHTEKEKKVSCRPKINI